METWAQYQSLLQLAAGTNIAITGLITVYGSEFVREGRRIETVVRSAENFIEKIAPDPSTNENLKKKLSALITEAKRLFKTSIKEEKSSNALVVVATITCLLAALLSFVWHLSP